MKLPESFKKKYPLAQDFGLTLNDEPICTNHSALMLVPEADLLAFIKSRERMAWNACQRFYLNSPISYEAKTPGTGLYYAGWEEHFREWAESDDYQRGEP